MNRKQMHTGEFFYYVVGKHAGCLRYIRPFLFPTVELAMEDIEQYIGEKITWHKQDTDHYTKQSGVIKYRGDETQDGYSWALHIIEVLREAVIE